MIVKVDGKDWMVPEGYDTVMYEDEYVTHDGCLAIRSKSGGGIVTVDEAGVIHGLLEEDNVDRIERHCEKEYYAKKDDKDKEPYHLIPEICFREVRRSTPKYVWAQAMRDAVAGLEGRNSSFVWQAEVLEVLKYGLKKYGEENSWQKVDNAQDRYSAALVRHALDVEDSDEGIDPESGISHVNHMLCNMLFLLWFEIQEDRNTVTYGGIECHK
jgi:hypothetical protein